MLTFNSGDLGKTKATTEVVVADADDHNAKLNDATLVLSNALAAAATIDAQKLYMLVDLQVLMFLQDLKML